MSQIRYVEGSQLTATRVPGSVALRLEIADDRCIPNARVRRAFPLSTPADYLSLQGADGKEIAMLRNLGGLSPETQRLLHEELDRRYFTPRIDRIEVLKAEAGMWRFKVDTQRGPAEFFVRNWRDSAVEITRNRWQIMSVDGGRFEILDITALDPVSLRLLDQLL